MTPFAPCVDAVRFRGRVYRLDPDFHAVFRAMEQLERRDLLPEVRTEKALRCLVRGRLPRDKEGLLALIWQALFPKREGRGGPPVISYEQDEERIIAAFWQAYGIDLTSSRLHWRLFQALLGSLPGDTRMAEIAALRAQPVPPPNKYNKDARERLARAKASVAIKGAAHDAKSSSDALGSAILKLIGG